MGADLCGYILVGPKKLEKKKVKAVKQRFSSMKITAQKMQADRDWNSVAKLHKAFPEIDLDRSDVFGCEPAEAIEHLANMEVNLVVEFVELWEHGGSWRDYMSRLFKDRLILVVGERSFGDGPETGSAWWMVDQLEALGLLDGLGIK